MIHKKPKSTVYKWSQRLKRGAIALLVADAVCCIGTYFIWRKVNTERDFRKYLYVNYPSVLEGYYKVGDFFDSRNQARQIDLAYWQKESTWPLEG